MQCFQKNISPHEAMICKMKYIKETMSINSAIELRKLREEEKQKMMNSIRM